MSSIFECSLPRNFPSISKFPTSHKMSALASLRRGGTASTHAVLQRADSQVEPLESDPLDNSQLHTCELISIDDDGAAITQYDSKQPPPGHPSGIVVNYHTPNYYHHTSVSHLSTIQRYSAAEAWKYHAHELESFQALPP